MHWSDRFGRSVRMTRHARQRMVERDIDDSLVRELLENGEVRHKDSRRVWVAASFDGRSDNLICAAVALEDQVVVKTVMHHFRWRA